MVLGRYTVSDPSHIQWLNGFGQAGVFSFTPTGNFGTAANNGILALAAPGSSSFLNDSEAAGRGGYLEGISQR